LGVLGNGRRRCVWGKKRSKPPVDCAETLKRLLCLHQGALLLSSPVASPTPALIKALPHSAGRARLVTMKPTRGHNARMPLDLGHHPPRQQARAER
jgi:hypothetical protein